MMEVGRTCQYLKIIQTACVFLYHKRALLPIVSSQGTQVKLFRKMALLKSHCINDDITSSLWFPKVWMCWEAVGKGDFKYLSIGLKVKFFYRRIFRQWTSIFLSHDFVFSTLASSSSNPTHYAIAQFMIFSILCTIQYRIHWMLTLILPLSVKRSKRF